MALPILFFVLSSVLCDANATYTTKYDNIDIDEVIKNERLVKRYVECLLETGACTPDGLELRNNMPDAIATNCASCSEKQKEGSEKFIAFLIDEKPEYWNPLQLKYDPSGEYTRKYMENKNNGVANNSSNQSSSESEDNYSIYHTKMKSITFSIIFIIVLTLHYVELIPADGEGIFLNKYNVDVDQILKSQRLFLNYVNCILDKAPCTQEGKTLKEQIPIAMKTECAQCSAEEKKQVGKILSYILQYHRPLWDQLMNKYDTDGSFRKKYEYEDEDGDD
nr:uncharacterized protein LOC111422079 [Onthophagus taurus]